MAASNDLCAGSGGRILLCCFSKTCGSVYNPARHKMAKIWSSSTKTFLNLILVKLSQTTDAAAGTTCRDCVASISVSWCLLLRKNFLATASRSCFWRWHGLPRHGCSPIFVLVADEGLCLQIKTPGLLSDQSGGGVGPIASVQPSPSRRSAATCTCAGPPRRASTGTSSTGSRRSPPAASGVYA